MKAAYGDDAPIAARATAFAESALSLIRVSGRDSVRLLSACFSRPAALAEAAGNSIVRGWITDGGKRIDEVLVGVYRAPKSYTGEESADITCHGGLAAGRAVLAALWRHGFREALPGEFTFRAFMNGKIDLTRAESVMEIVGAKSDAGRERAVTRLAGALEREIRAVKDGLLGVLAEIELLLDYSELDGVSADDEALPGRAQAEDALVRLRRLRQSYRAEKLYRDGALAVIAGRPNAGKSSLFNLLLREERAITSDIPGTTRDWIEGALSIEGIPVRLADTAGLREVPVLTDAPDAQNAPDAIEAIEALGIERSCGLLEQADIVILVLDGSLADGPHGEAEEFRKRWSGAPVLTVWNKADLALPPDGGDFCPVSAKTGYGLDTLCGRIADTLVKAAGAEAGGLWSGAGLGSARQKALIDAAADALEAALAAHDEGLPADLIAPLLREAVDRLGEITGEVSSADILETMFSRFCIGK